MTLTQDDLLAIKGIIDSAFEESDQRTAAGFAEVHEKLETMDEKLTHHDQQFTNVRTDLGRIENKLTPTIEQVEDHEIRISGFESNIATA